jgi:hypothetical protein
LSDHHGIFSTIFRWNRNSPVIVLPGVYVVVEVVMVNGEGRELGSVPCLGIIATQEPAGAP